MLPGVVLPAAGQGLAAGLLRELLHASFQLRPEVTDQTLDGPGERLTKG